MLFLSWLVLLLITFIKSNDQKRHEYRTYAQQDAKLEWWPLGKAGPQTWLQLFQILRLTQTLSSRFSDLRGSDLLEPSEKIDHYQ